MSVSLLFLNNGQLCVAKWLRDGDVNSQARRSEVILLAQVSHARECGTEGDDGPECRHIDRNRASEQQIVETLCAPFFYRDNAAPRSKVTHTHACCVTYGNSRSFMEPNDSQTSKRHASERVFYAFVLGSHDDKAELFSSALAQVIALLSCRRAGWESPKSTSCSCGPTQ